MKKIAILGVSGSIGQQTIDVLKNNRDQFELVAFSIGKNIDYANEIIKTFQNIKLICVQNKEDIPKINFPNVVCGEEGLTKVAILQEIDIVVTAVVGSVGLVPTVAAIKAKKTIALANKETLVMAGDIIMPLSKENNVQILPVDSEHSAIFQALNGEKKQTINKLIITASGGTFRDKSLKELNDVSVKEALQHPNWSMGDKITIDSATMFNKALEIIEAHHLFGVPYNKIEAIIHKQSIVHSMVEYVDGSIIAQLGTPDMKGPIQYALTYPNRQKIVNHQSLNWQEIKSLDFQIIDKQRFEAIDLVYKYAAKGGSYPTVLNAANEKANELFLQDKIKFLDIINIVKEELKNHNLIDKPTLKEVIKLDQEIKNKIERRYK